MLYTNYHGNLEVKYPTQLIEKQHIIHSPGAQLFRWLRCQLPKVKQINQAYLKG